VFIVVDKGCQLLHVYQYGHLAYTYPMVFSSQDGRKLYEGDKRTPVGLYMIIGKRDHPRWSRFMLLDYPTPADMHRYQQHKKKGKVPRRTGKTPGPGGEIGIHGTNHRKLNEAKVNWTFGCISLLNPDIRKLYARAPKGTLVYIKE
jgi:murein L,D-transpeptidase YafK